MNAITYKLKPKWENACLKTELLRRQNNNYYDQNH